MMASAEVRQRQHWRDLAASAESFCLRFNNRDMRQFVFDVCSATWSESYDTFNKLASQHLVEHDFRVNLLHRRDMAILPAVWNEYTELYEARLLGTHDESSSDDYDRFLAGLAKDQVALDIDPPSHGVETISTTPSLGHIEAQIQSLVWDDTTMVFTVLLSEIWTGVNGVRYNVPPKSAELAHLLVGTLMHDNPDRLDVGEQFIRRWRANDQSQGQFKVLDAGVGGLPILKVDVCPILPTKRTCRVSSQDIIAEALIMDVLPRFPDTERVTFLESVPEIATNPGTEQVTNPTNRPVSTTTADQAADRQHSHADDQLSSEPSDNESTNL